MKRALLLTLLLLIPACRPDSADDSNTPEALYERAKELLKPNVERQESDLPEQWSAYNRQPGAAYCARSWIWAVYILPAGRGWQQMRSRHFTGLQRLLPRETKKQRYSWGFYTTMVHSARRMFKKP